MKTCLVVYYSRTGVTARIAESLAQSCGADLERIQDSHSRLGAAGYLRSAWQAMRGLPGEIAPPSHNPAEYPFIVLGTPVWAGHMSAPMRAYILQKREHFRRVGLFCTMGGSGGRNTIQAMAELCNQLPVASMCLRQTDVLAGRHLASVLDFAGELATLQRDAPPAEASAGGESLHASGTT